MRGELSGADADCAAHLVHCGELAEARPLTAASKAGWSRSRLDPETPACSATGCASPATIIHRSMPYCGKHALELLESGESPERPGEYSKLRSNHSGGAINLPQI
jgi:hypothetical protein